MSEGDSEKFKPIETSQGLPVVSETTVKAIESQFTTGGEGRKWGEQLDIVASLRVSLPF